MEGDIADFSIFGIIMLESIKLMLLSALTLGVLGYVAWMANNIIDLIKFKEGVSPNWRRLRWFMFSAILFIFCSAPVVCVIWLWGKGIIHFLSHFD